MIGTTADVVPPSKQEITENGKDEKSEKVPDDTPSVEVVKGKRCKGKTVNFTLYHWIFFNISFKCEIRSQGSVIKEFKFQKPNSCKQSTCIMLSTKAIVVV